MKRILISAMLMGLTVQAHADATFLGADEQDVRITAQTNGAINVVSTSTVIEGTVSVTFSEDAVNVVSTHTVIYTGAGAIQVTSTNTTVNATDLDIRDLSASQDNVAISDGTDTMLVNPDGSINSTTTLHGSGGQQITSQTSGSSVALHTSDINLPKLGGRVYISTLASSMIATEVIGFTGLGKSLVLQAKNGECTWSLNSGPAIIVFKNTANSIDMNYLQTDPSLELTALDAGNTTCRAYMDGAQ